MSLFTEFAPAWDLKMKKLILVALLFSVSCAPKVCVLRQNGLSEHLQFLACNKVVYDVELSKKEFDDLKICIEKSPKTAPGTLK